MQPKKCFDIRKLFCQSSATMTVLSVKEVRALGDELQRDPLQHANHAVSLLNCINTDVQEVWDRTET